MSRILGRSYSEIELNEFKFYKLFKVARGNLKYTGFNMGAGENAVLWLFLEILRAGKGALIIVDEIELGLHAQAQIRLVKELKKICNKQKCQIVFSTHSKEILKSLPPESRIFITRNNYKADIIPAISADYAFGKLSGEGSNELLIFVEDSVGKAFLENILPYNIRERIKIIAAGSYEAVLKHIAVHYREDNLSCMAFLDGDMHTRKEEHKNKVRKYLETRLNHSDDIFNKLIDERLQYIPGDFWPEKVLISEASKSKDLSHLQNNWGNIPQTELLSIFDTALTAEKHSEFFVIAKKVHLSEDQVRADIIKLYKDTHGQEIINIEKSINTILR